MNIPVPPKLDGEKFARLIGFDTNGQISPFEALEKTLRDPGSALRLIASRELCNLLRHEDFKHYIYRLPEFWGQLHDEDLRYNSALEKDKRLLGLWARCQVQLGSPPFSPHHNPNWGDPLVWMLDQMREWKGQTTLRIEKAKPDLLGVWAMGLAASEYSKGSSGTPIKSIVLGCAGYLEQLWPGCLAQSMTTEKHHLGMATLLRKGRQLQNHRAQKEVWKADQWRYATTEEIGNGINALLRISLTQKVHAEPEAPGETARRPKM